MTATASSNGIVESIGEGDVDALRKRVQQMPLMTAFAEFHSAMKIATAPQRRELWRLVGNGTDRLTGILCVADLRMPPRPVFGPFKMEVGVKETDYDRARTFILETRSKENVVGQVPGMFYPELASIDPAKRALFLASKHIGCTPTCNRQLNLFSMRGAFNRKLSTVATHKRTTCALFARSVLTSAGDQRFTRDSIASAKKQLYGQTNMLNAIGVQMSNNTISSSEWVSALPSAGSPNGSTALPSVGDIYFVAIPSAGWVRSETILADSGHVGFVAAVHREGENRVVLETYDGGQGTDGLRSTFTAKRVLSKNAKGHWEQTSHASVKGENRILVGWVDMGKIASKFVAERGMMMDGRTYCRVL
ncbi:MAG: hypothetical protein KDB00_24955 [Planctomycetales bacterium]|nr:hypothetical protein [Planctomycetales bacterium]